MTAVSVAAVLCEPPSWLFEDGEIDLPDPLSMPESPAWLLEVVPAIEEPVRWAVPGVWDDEVAPQVGALVEQLQVAVLALDDVNPADLPGTQARVEAEALFVVMQRLRVLQLARIRDVRARELYGDVGFRGLNGWLQTMGPDAHGSDGTLAKRLGDRRHVDEAVLSGALSLDGARRVTDALAKITTYLDRENGLIDGQDGEELVASIVTNTVALVSREHCGLSDEDPLLVELQRQVEDIRDSPGSQAERVERAFTLLAVHVPQGKALSAALEEQVDAVLPNLLEQQEAAAQRWRGLSFTPRPDGAWDVKGTLTPACGERLYTGLSAEARRDPDNPKDTELWAEETVGADGSLITPRTRARRLHDALDRLLSRYLEAGLGGTHDKVPVQVTVTVGVDLIEGRPGALPGKGASGRPLARSLLRRWWCDAQVTSLILSRGWKPLGMAHTGRTLTGAERKAAGVQFDQRCAGLECCSGRPDPLVKLVPHHLIRYVDGGTTSLEETVLACPTLHHDLHSGKLTVRLRDGRLVNEHGVVERVRGPG